MTKRKSLFCTMLIVALMMAMCTPVFAAKSDEGISPYDTASIVSEFTRKSNTSAESSVVVNLTQVATTATCTITLQENKNGSWVTATGVSPVTQSKTVTDRSGILMGNNWNLTKGKNYRLKITCKDKTNGLSYTTTAYSNTI